MTVGLLGGCGRAGGEGRAAAGSPRSSAGKGTYRTSLAEVRDTAVCPRHLSAELHTSTETKAEAGDRGGRTAPARHCPEGLWVNVCPLIMAQHG